MWQAGQTLATGRLLDWSLAMTDWRKAYTERQRRFWNVSTKHEARFERVMTAAKDPEGDWRNTGAADIARVFAHVKPSPEWTILEIGCGAGRLLSHVAERYQFARLIGVDISEQMVTFARDELGSDSRIELQVNSGYDVSGIESDSVDFAYSVDVFIHIFDSDVVAGYLSEVKRVLRPSAAFRFNVRRYDASAFALTPGGLLARVQTTLGLYSPGKHRWQPDQQAEFNGNQYTARDLRSLVAGSGLQLLELQPSQAQWWLTVARPGSATPLGS